MRKAELSRRLARRTGRRRAEAADELDHVVHRILIALRKVEEAELPGLGTFGADGRFRFEAGKPERGER